MPVKTLTKEDNQKALNTTTILTPDPDHHPVCQKQVKEATSLAVQHEIIAATLKRGKDRAR